MLCEFPNLNKLCRLHCSTEMLKGQISVPENMIGFDGCTPNPPDRRCFENDIVVDDETKPTVSTCKQLDDGKMQVEHGGTKGSTARKRNFTTSETDHIPSDNGSQSLNEVNNSLKIFSDTESSGSTISRSSCPRF